MMKDASRITHIYFWFIKCLDDVLCEGPWLSTLVSATFVHFDDYVLPECLISARRLKTLIVRGRISMVHMFAEGTSAPSWTLDSLTLEGPHVGHFNRSNLFPESAHHIFPVSTHLNICQW